MFASNSVYTETHTFSSETWKIHIDQIKLTMLFKIWNEIYKFYYDFRFLSTFFSSCPFQTIILVNRWYRCYTFLLSLPLLFSVGSMNILSYVFEFAGFLYTKTLRFTKKVCFRFAKATIMITMKEKKGKWKASKRTKKQ